MDKTAIENLAIIFVGGKSIVSNTDDRKAADLVKLLWDTSRQGMLELPHNWKFATTRLEITGNVTTAPEIGQYSYRYKLPKLCLRVIAQIDEDDDNLEYEHRIENYLDSSSKPKTWPVIVTNESKCFIKYIHDLNQAYEIRRWPGWFARLVALDIAINMCEPLKQDKRKVNQLALMMHAPNIGYMARAIQANGLYGSDTTSEDRDTDRGNNEALNASRTAGRQRKRIISRE